MIKINEEMHPQLVKLMTRSDITLDDVVPDKQEKLLEMLRRISRSYYDHDQDQYLLERSMNISSREMMELNEKLESAQNIAHLGYWHYNREEDSLLWTKEMYRLAGMEPSEGAPKLDVVMNYFHKNDRPRFASALQEAFSGKMVEIELQFKNKKEKKYYWHYVKINPDINPEEPSESTPISSVSGVVMDITERKIYEKNAEKIQNQLLSVSRKAGMSEVATYVLHNIGNILNSAYVSLDILKDSFSQPYYEKLFKISALIQENHNDLDVFLTKDVKGKLIPSYLVELVAILKKEHEKNVTELHHLDDNLIHIKDIVSMQKAIGGTSSVFEKIFVPELLDTALRMSIKGILNGVVVEKEYENTSFVMTDKSKLLQILVNLLQNAHDSVLKNKHNAHATITIRIKNGADTVQVSIADNGVGIAPENIDRIFSFGFTTKEHGHGFGLHSCALSAKELGGSLTAHSAGVDCGASFILTLPVNKGKSV